MVKYLTDGQYNLFRKKIKYA